MKLLGGVSDPVTTRSNWQMRPYGGLHSQSQDLLQTSGQVAAHGGPHQHLGPQGQRFGDVGRRPFGEIMVELRGMDTNDKSVQKTGTSGAETALDFVD